MNNITSKIDRMRSERNWTVYKLSQLSGLPAPTIRKWSHSEMYPSIPTLMQICEAFGITLADFFSEGALIEVTPKTKELYNDWCALSTAEQSSVENIIKNYLSKK